jgi:type II secretory pathway component PulC
MKLATLVLVITAAVAHAAPTQVVDIEVDRAELATSWSTLPEHDLEPGGASVPANADASWFRIGLQANDIVRYVDGDPVKSLDEPSDGLTMIEVQRGGRRVMLRVLIHGKDAVKSEINESAFQTILERLADPDPRVSPVRDKRGLSGVRVVDFFLGIHLELERGDIVRTIGGTPIYSDAAFVAAIQKLPVGFTEVIVERYGRRVSIELTRTAPIDRTTIQRVSATRFDIARATFEAMGEDAHVIEQQVEAVPRVERGLTTGLRLAKVEPGSLCAALGLQVDDVLLEIEGRSIGSFDGVYAAHGHLANAPQVTIKLERKRKRIAITYVIR